MPAPTIDPLPSAPSRGSESRTQFVLTTDAFLAALNPWGVQLQAVADYVGGIAGGAISWGDIGGTLSDQTDLQAALDAKLASSSYTAADVLSKLLGVDGPGSGLDADTLDGHDAGYFLAASAAYTDEMARDAIGTALTDTGLAVVTVNDGADTIDINVPAAAASDINTGTDTTKALTADALAGSNLGTATVTILVSDPGGSAISTGDGKAYYRVPSTLNGMNLVGVAMALTTASSSGIPTVQIANVTDAVDMLSTKLTVDANETDSSTAAAAAVIDGTKDDVATGDKLRIDVDVAGTGAKGLIVELQFRLP